MWSNLTENFSDILLDCTIDSLKVLAVVLIINILLSFVEDKIAKHLSKSNSKFAPFFASMFGLIPQCGVSVVASDLYLKKHITVGTLIAIFLACSDEALPIMLAGNGNSALMTIPLLLIKFVIGFTSGFLIDWILTRRKAKAGLLTTVNSNKEIEKNKSNYKKAKVNSKALISNDEEIIASNTCELVKLTKREETQVHVGCCNHEIDDMHEDKWHKHLLHPLIHSLKLFIYVYLINFVFNCLVALITEEALISFLDGNKYFAPLFSVLIGLIPNCASSVIISSMFVANNLSFGSALAGLCVNAGLGLVFLFKNKSRIKENLCILATLICISLFVGYVCCLIFGF